MGSVYDAPKTSLGKYNCLPEDLINEWAKDQILLSVSYAKGGILGTSDSVGGKKKKAEIMQALSEKFLQPHCIVNYDEAIALFNTRLEDPGMMQNFIYFDAINSDDMLLFFYRIWRGEMARSLEAVYGDGYDLSGNFRNCPLDESWYRMICYESMTINERQKAKFEAETIVGDSTCKAITYFGGGIPHLHHFYEEACRDRVISVYDNGYIPTEEEIDRFNQNYDLLRFYNISLLQVANERWNMRGTQDLVIMSGVSMYLYEAGKPTDECDQKMLSAMKNANVLLKKGGSMLFDFLLPTVCMKRLAITQHWPNAQSMKIFETCEDAIDEARRIVDKYNETIISPNESKFFLEDIKVNTAQPWGPTSVFFALRKM